MNEAAVKAALLAHVRAANGRRKKPVVTAELTLGRSGVRADLVVFADSVIGFEIKTEKDTLRRLQAQMTAYCKYFDHVVAVVAPCHVRNLKSEQIANASVWTYDANGRIAALQHAPRNPVMDGDLEDILTKAEKGKIDFSGAMNARYGETSKAFWSAVARRHIKPEDLHLLSRFADGREQAKRFASDRAAWWTQWLSAQNASNAISA